MINTTTANITAKKPNPRPCSTGKIDHENNPTIAIGRKTARKTAITDQMNPLNVQIIFDLILAFIATIGAPNNLHLTAAFSCFYSSRAHSQSIFYR